jgi:hypothetical protein
MKRRLILVAAVALATSGAMAANLHPNPGFETSIGYPVGPGTVNAANWSFTWSTADQPSPSSTNRNNAWPSTPARTGSSGCGISASSNITLQTVSTNRPAVTGGSLYTVSAYVKYGIEGSVFGVRWFDFANNLIRTDTRLLDAYYADWTQVLLTTNAPANASRAAFYFFAVGRNSFSAGQNKFVSSYIELDDTSLDNNNPPVVNAGNAMTVGLGGSVMTAATASDPEGNPLLYSWNADPGNPAAVTFGTPSSLNTTVSGFTTPGTYILRLSVGDGTYVITRSVSVSTSGNLLGNNPGFELSAGLYPAASTTNYTTTMPGWQMFWQNPDENFPKANDAWPATPAQEGTNGWGISATGPTWLETAAADRAVVTNGRMYTLSFFMKYAMQYQAQGIRWYNSGGTLIGQTTNNFYADSLSSSWKQFYITGIAPTGAARAAAYFYGRGNISYSQGQGTNVPGYVELDNFALRTNNPPIVSAGPAQAGFTNAYTLAGTATDPNSNPLTSIWTKVSGPGTATFSNPNALNPLVTFSTPGIYIMRLTSTDGTYTIPSDVSINYLASPFVNLLGDNYGFENTNSPIYIESTGQTDMSLPGWLVAFTVATVDPKNGNNVGIWSTSASGGNGFDGSSALYISCYAGGTVTLTTESQARALIASPGSVYRLSNAQSAVPAGGVAGIQWFNSTGGLIQVDTYTPSGSGFPNFRTSYRKFVSPTNAAWAGVYYQSSGGFGLIDNFSITLSTNNEPPEVYAGIEMTRIFGSPVTLPGMVTDGDPLDVLSIVWTKVSGPGSVTFGNPNLARTTASFGALGDYVLRMTADDGNGHVVSKDVTVHIVNPTGERVLVFCGQSNMEGHGTPNTASNLPPALKGVITNVWGFYANEMDFIGGAPQQYGEQTYNYINTWASMKTNIVHAGVTGSYYIAGGTYQPYSWWKSNWVGYSRTSPTDPTRQPYPIEKGTTDLKFWTTGLNPGEPWANANTFASGEPNQVWGPDLMAAWTIGTNRPNEKFWIVKYAPGGTSLAGDWNPSRTDGRYVGMQGWVECALAERPGAVLGGFFWLQGESDCGSGANYYRDLTNLIARVRGDFSVPDLPVVICQIHPGNPQDPGPDQRFWTNSNYGVVYFGGTNGNHLVRKAQLDASINLTNVMTVNADDFQMELYETLQAGAITKSLPPPQNNYAVYYNVVTNRGWTPIHFGLDATLAIGRRMGNAWLGMVPPLPTNAPASGYNMWASSITNGQTNYNDSATGDGYPNLLKYATGSSPTTPDMMAHMNMQASGATFAIKFNRDTNATDVTLVVEGADTVVNGALWNGITTNKDGMWSPTGMVIETGNGSPKSVTVQDTSSNATSRYLRLRVIRP